MTPEQKRTALAARVETFLTEAGTTQRQKKCSECGRGFLGRDDAAACSERCKKRKQRK